MSEAIEIRPGDIIRRPPTLPPSVTSSPGQGESSGFNLKTIKGYIEQIKELKEAAESMGLDMGNLGLKFPGQKKQAMPMPDAPTATTATQIKNFLKFLQAVYGDITIDELLVKLKNDFGSKKISEFMKGGMV